jgi:DNA-binding GntR family transcriptional regulator
MSTGTFPNEDRAADPARARRGTDDAPSLIAELVFRELVEADEALTESEIRERTLLPGAEIREALSELASRGLCTARRRTTDHAPRRYAPAFPTNLGA